LSRKKCPDCGEELVQMLECPFKSGSEHDHEENYIHYGHYCKSCKIMFKRQWEYVRDE